MQGVGEAIVVRDPDGQILYANDNAARVLGFNSVAELLATPISQIVPRLDFYTERGEPLPAARLPSSQALQGVELPPTIVRYHPSLTGEERWAEIKAIPVRDDHGLVQCAASVEITERIQADQELQRYAERLQWLSRQLIEAQEAERRRIARDLHDQVGQSLTAIKIDLQVAQQQSHPRCSGRHVRGSTNGYRSGRIPVPTCCFRGTSQQKHRDGRAHNPAGARVLP